MFPRKYVIDHNHKRRMLIVLWGKETTAFERCAHHFQIARVRRYSPLPSSCRFHLPVWAWPSSQNSCSSSEPMGIAPHVCEDSLHPWGGCQVVIEFAKGGANPFRGGVHHRRWQIQTEAQNVARIKSRIHVPKSRQAAHHESCADQQHQGNRHLDHDKDALCAMLSRSRRGRRP